MFAHNVIALALNKTLVGGWPTPLKNMKVNRDDYSILFQYMEKYKMFQSTNQKMLQKKIRKQTARSTLQEPLQAFGGLRPWQTAGCNNDENM